MDRLSALVHESARGDEIERLCHVHFLAAHLVAAAFGLILLLLDLTLVGVPTFLHAGAYAGLVMILVAVRHVSRSGDLRRGLIWSSLTILATALLVSVQGGLSLPATYAWIIVAILEASFLASAQWMKRSALLACGSALLIGLMQSKGWLHAPAHAPGLGEALLLIPAVGAACSLCVLAMQIGHIRKERSAAVDGQFAALCATMQDLVLRLDRSGAVIAVSRDPSEALGLNSGDLIGRGLFERVHVADRPAFLRLISDSVRSPETLSAQMRLRSGTMRHEATPFDAPVFIWVELRARNFKPAQPEESAEVVVIIRDITQAKEAEAQLALAQDQAEGSTIWKDQFLACVSHELRTPLNAIIGFSEILGNDALVPKDRAKIVEYANIIQSSGEHLLSVVNSILDVSKIQSGRFELTPEPFALAPLVDQCFDIVSLKAGAKQIRLDKDIPARIEDIVADKRACKQIILNLLSNAVKFTPDR
ncbi:MAG: PAS domain S-box protein, partial [Alphaproteobacteria bacterium]|nr:PAS domain S-box protein [Alphaproteobacteria bacterium]